MNTYKVILHGNEGSQTLRFDAYTPTGALSQTARYAAKHDLDVKLVEVEVEY